MCKAISPKYKIEEDNTTQIADAILEMKVQENKATKKKKQFD